MGITQNGVVWITNKGARILLCIVNFAIIRNFAMIAKIWHSENFARTAKFSLPLRNFRYVIAKITAPPALLPASISLHFFISSLTKSLRIHTNPA